ncbi:Acetyltransferase, partial [Pseudomonas cannabina]
QRLLRWMRVKLEREQSGQYRIGVVLPIALSCFLRLNRQTSYCGVRLPMSTVMLLQTPPPEFIRSQIQQMVVDYVTDISLVAIVPSNPLYNLYQYGVGYEVHLYLNAMDGSQDLTVELIVALDDDDPEIVSGFLLYLPVQNDPQACA